MSGVSNSESNEPDSAAYDKLDFTAIRFPSDQLTIQALRRIYPDRFDLGFERDGELQPHFFPHEMLTSLTEVDPGVGLLGSMLFSERLIAAFAYGRDRGWPDPDDWGGELGLQGFKQDLAEFYEKFQIAPGPQAAAEMIRNIETQARELAASILR